MNLEQTIKLIKTVSEYPCLWNPKHSQFYNGILEMESWENIAAKLGRDSDDCRLEWRKVFDCYLNAMTSTTLPPKLISRLTQHFEFLVPIVIERVKQTNDTSVVIDLSVDKHGKENMVEECNGNLEETCSIEEQLNQNMNLNPLEVSSIEEELNYDFVGEPSAACSNDEQSIHEESVEARQIVFVDRRQAKYDWMNFFQSNISDILELDESKQRKLKRIIIEHIEKLYDGK